MTLQQRIETNEEKLRQYKEFIASINLLMENKDDKKSIEFLLEIQKLEFEGRIERGMANQEALKKQRMVEFEIESAEANSRIDRLIMEISTWIGKEPIGVTGKIQPLVETYEREKGDYTQEQRNLVYLELKGHFNFLTKTYQNK